MNYHYHCRQFGATVALSRNMPDVPLHSTRITKNVHQKILHFQSAICFRRIRKPILTLMNQLKHSFNSIAGVSNRHNGEMFTLCNNVNFPSNQSFTAKDPSPTLHQVESRVSATLPVPIID